MTREQYLAQRNALMAQARAALDSGNLEFVFENLRYIIEDGDIYIDLRFVPSYFMSDPSFEDQVVCGAEFYIEYNEQHNEEFGLFYSHDIEVVESYGVKLISSEIDPPIANEYKRFWE